MAVARQLDKRAVAVKRRAAAQPRRAAAARRRRRTTGEIIDRMIDAAIEEFEANGYAGATTAAIARRAGVVEALLFKHFGTKANLFQKAIFKPLDAHFAAFHAAQPRGGESLQERLEAGRRYVGEMQQFIADHSRMFLSLVVNQAYRAAGIGSVAQMNALEAYFDKMARMARARMRRRSGVNPELVTRLTFATILASVVFRDWLIPRNVASDAEIRKAVVDFVIAGVNDGQPLP